MRGLTVVGTDTGVGKTWVAALIVRELRQQGMSVGAYKPVCSGAIYEDGERRWTDVELLREALGGNVPRARIAPQCFDAALAPPVAARQEGRSVDDSLIEAGLRWWDGRAAIVIVETAGGLLSPVSDRRTSVDVARDLGFPAVLVARSGLGTINHTLLSVEAAGRRGVPLAGIVLNDESAAPDPLTVRTNAEEIAARCAVPVLGRIARGMSAGLLRDGDRIRMDWTTLVAGTTPPGPDSET